MPRGSSGRIVIHIDPNLKRALYVKLAQTNSSLKSWFIDKAEQASQEPAKNEHPLPPISKDTK
jgi:predicted HicB family RNase H-like nuclease